MIQSAISEAKNGGSAGGGECGGAGGGLHISTHAVDLSDLDHLETRIRDILDTVDQEDSNLTSSCWNQTILINNAGSVGKVGPSHTTSSLLDIKKAIDFNVTSSIWLSSYFIRYFSKAKQCNVINMSSLCAVEPFPTMGVYCAGKASRDMYHAVLGKEQEEDSGRIKILNYAPGPVESDMTETLSESDDLDSGLRSYFKTSLMEKTLIQPHITANRLVDLVMDGNYTNGQHVDFYDLDKKVEDE